MDASLKRMMMDEDVYNSYEFKQQLLAAVSSLPQSLRITFSEAFQKRKGERRLFFAFLLWNEHSRCGKLISRSK